MEISRRFPALRGHERDGDGGSAVPIVPRHITEPVLVLKADVSAPYSRIDEVVRGLAEAVDQVVLLTMDSRLGHNP